MGQPPVDEVHGLLFLPDGLPVYAGRYEHEGALAPHAHSFVEVVVVTGGDGVHHAPGGRRRPAVGDMVLLRPGVSHGYDAEVHRDPTCPAPASAGRRAGVGAGQTRAGRRPPRLADGTRRGVVRACIARSWDRPSRTDGTAHRIRSHAEA
ncbi:AraC family ligand binding domain-containing protein [Streptomyces luteogriseus]|uniref:AraC family ligand binding domain-containing protein n=1 Tax=Streptomyces luteogriseus TaxID=68233 RepID=UPI00369EBBDA